MKNKSDSIRIEKIISLINKFIQKCNRSIKILDLGCGDGYILSMFSKKNDCFGIDKRDKLTIDSKNSIKFCKIDLDVNKLPYNDDHFDLIICAQVIEHLRNTDYVLSEVNRVLKKDGFLILSFPNINQPLSILIQMFLDYPPIFAARYKAPHIRDFTLRTMKIALYNNGFKIKSIYGTTIKPFKNALNQYFANKFPRLSERIIIIANVTHKPYITPRIVGDTRQLLSEKFKYSNIK